MADQIKVGAGDTIVVIRQEKDNPEGWHVAAQGGNPAKLLQEAKRMSRHDNEAFGVQKGGDIAGNNVNYYMMTKDELGVGFNMSAESIDTSED